jgi:hypothetical protein
VCDGSGPETPERTASDVAATTELASSLASPSTLAATIESVPVDFYGTATADPQVVAAGGSLMFAPTAAVTPTCGGVGVLRSTDTGHAIVGQLTSAGSFNEGPDVTWLECLLTPTAAPTVYFIPASVPAGRYVLCMSEQLDTASCATITVTAPPATTPPPPPASGVRIETATGCPATISDQPLDPTTGSVGILNPDRAGLGDAFVPGDPTGALICRYYPLTINYATADGQPLTGGTLFSSTTLVEADAVRVADELNDISYWNFTPSCVPFPLEPRFTAIVFTVPGHADTDVWLRDAHWCPYATNGRRDSGLLVNGHGQRFIDLLDAAAPEAPAPPPPDGG